MRICTRYTQATSYKYYMVYNRIKHSEFSVIFLHRSYSVVVSTPDFESGIPGSNPGRTMLFLSSFIFPNYLQQLSLMCLQTFYAHSHYHDTVAVCATRQAPDFT